MSTIFNHTLTTQNETIFIPFEYNPLLSTIEVLSTSPINYTYDNVSKTITITDTLTLPLDITIRRKTVAPTETFDRGNLSSTKLNDVFKRQQLALVELQDGGSVYINKDLNMNGFNIVNMADGINAKDAVNKSQLDVTLNDIQSLESSYTTLQTEYNDLLVRVVDLENNSGGGSNTPSIINISTYSELLKFSAFKTNATTRYNTGADGIRRLLFDGFTFFKKQSNSQFINPVELNYTEDLFSGKTKLSITNMRYYTDLTSGARLPIKIGFHQPIVAYNNIAYNTLSLEFNIKPYISVYNHTPTKIQGFIIESDVNNSFESFASNIKATKVFDIPYSTGVFDFSYEGNIYKFYSKNEDGLNFLVDFGFSELTSAHKLTTKGFSWFVDDTAPFRQTGVFIPERTFVLMFEFPPYPSIAMTGNSTFDIEYNFYNGGVDRLYIGDGHYYTSKPHNVQLMSSNLSDTFRFYPHNQGNNFGIYGGYGVTSYSNYQLFGKSTSFYPKYSVRLQNLGSSYNQPINDNYRVYGKYLTDINIAPLLYMYKHGNTQNSISPSYFYNTGSGSSSLSFPVIYNDGIDDYRTIQLNMPNMSNVYDTVAFSKDGDLL